jgi:hypothetical protein
MAAPKGNKNGLGNSGGKSLNDRQLAASVRKLALTEIQKYLEGKEEGYQDKEYKQAIILKLAPSLLPRLNEHTGEDGGEIPVKITGFNYIIPNGSNNQTDMETAPSVASSQ